MTISEVYDISTKLGFNAFYCNGNTGVLVYPQSGASGWCVMAMSDNMTIIEHPKAVAHKTKTVLSWGYRTNIQLNLITATDFEKHMKQVLIDLDYANKQIQLSKNLKQINKDFK